MPQTMSTLRSAAALDTNAEVEEGTSRGTTTPTLVSSDPISILIVDDEPKNLAVLETVLEDPGYRLVRAESPEQALLALLVEDFALLILDIRMPGISGFELAQLIKARKKNAKVPIIFLTAYFNEDQHIVEGYGTGAVDYLHKPVNPTILRSKVGIFAELYRRQRDAEATNAALSSEVNSRRRAEEQLRELNNTLEQRVSERTEHIHHLMHEVDHRCKNLLSLVQSMARQTAISSSDDFVPRFQARLRALASSHDLLVSNNWQGIELVALIKAQLAHLTQSLDSRLKIDGPSLRLTSAAAQAIGMVLHELATNAIKFGALSNEAGRIEVQWSVGDSGQFSMSWVERDGPPVASPLRKGFGSTVLQAVAEMSLRGQVKLDFPKEGLTWRLETRKNHLVS